MAEDAAEGATAVLEALVAHPEARPAALAEAIGLHPSTVSRHLARLVQAGVVERRRHGSAVYYRIVPHLHVHWAGIVATPGDRPQNIALEWGHRGDVDWRFPLVTRIPDALAQEALQGFLDRCAYDGLFMPHLSHPEVKAWSNRITDEERQAVFRRRDEWASFSVIAFGSCARGEPQRESDLDLLVVGPPTEVLAEMSTFTEPPPDLKWRVRFEDLVNEMNLHAQRSRFIDLVTSTSPTLSDLPAALRRDVVQDGITVYRSGPRLPWVEVLGPRHDA